MRLSFPPLKWLLAASCLASILTAQTTTQTAAIVPAVYQMADFTPAGCAAGSCPATAFPAAATQNAAGVAEDAQGNLFLADTADGRIYKIASGSFATYGAATAVETLFASGLISPVALATDAAGNVYAADYGAKAVVGFTPSGSKFTVATGVDGPRALAVAPSGAVFFADGQLVYQAVPGSGGYAQNSIGTGTTSFLDPVALALDPDGNLYVADDQAHEVYRLALPASGSFSSAVASVFAGTGTVATYGAYGDGASAVSAELTTPTGLVIDPTGDVFIYDAGVGVIREVLTTGIIETVAGGQAWTGTKPTTGVASGTQANVVNAYGIQAVWFKGMSAPGPASEVSLSAMANAAPVSGLAVVPAAITLDGQGRLLMPTSSGQILAVSSRNFGRTAVGSTTRNYVFLQNTQIPSSSNTTTENFKTADIPVLIATNSEFAFLGGASSILGSTKCNSSSFNASTPNAPNPYCEVDLSFSPPAAGLESGYLQSSFKTTTLNSSVALTGTGLAPIAAGAVGQINAALTTGVAGAGYNGLAVNPWGALFGTDETNGVIEQLNGGVMQSLVPSVVRPTGIAFDPSGNLYYAETGGNTLREIPVVISSTGAWSYGTTSTQVLSGLSNPESIAADAYGDIYVADQGNGLIKEYIPGVTSLASPVIVAGGGSGTSLGGSATGIALVDPAGVAIDANGNLYISDQGNKRILRVSGGIITAIATNLPSTPWQLVLDPGGNLYAQTEVGTYLITAPASSSPVTTLIAGTGINAAAAGDGGPANAATFKRAVSLALASSVNANGVPQTTLYIGDYGTTSGVDEIRSISTANGAYATPAFASIPVNPAVPPTENVTLVNQGTASLTLATPNSSGPFSPSFLNTAWAATTAYTAGQQVLDANGDIESVTTAGTSGATAPAWATAVNGATTDGTVTWSNQGLACTTSGVPAGASCQAVVTFNPSGIGSWAFTPPPPSEAMPFGFSYPTSTGTATSSLNVYAAGAATAPLVTPTALAATPASAIVAAGTLLSAIQATIDDQNGNPITSGSGSTDSLTIAITSGPGSLAAGTPTVTAAAGVANFNNLVLDTPGTYTLTITDNTNTGVTPATVGVQVTAGSPALMTLVSGGAQSAFVSTAFANPVVFAVTDAFGNPVAGAPVTVTAPTSGAAATFTAPATSDGNGLVTITGVTANATAGAYNLTAVSGAASGVAGLTNLAANIITFPSEPVGTPTPSQPISFLFPNGGTVATATVVTQGYTGLDFTSADSANCVSTFNAGAACTVDVIFKPTQVGTRLGAVILYDASGNVLQTVYLGGVGNGSEIAFGGAAQTPYSVGAAGSQIAMDPKGDLFFASTGAFYEVPNNGGVLGAQQAFSVPSMSYGSAAAFDGAGNLYLSASNTEYKVPVVNGVPQMSQLKAYGLGTLPDGIASCNENAADASGNVFLACPHELVEIPAGTFAPRNVTSYNANNIQSIAIDSSDNVYVTEAYSNILYVVQSAASALPALQTYSYASQSLTPWALGIDAAGDVYFANGAGSGAQIYELSNAGGTLNTANPVAVPGATVAAPRSMAFDAAGNMYVAQGGGITVINQATAPALPDFGSVPVGGTSAVESETVENIGNQPLQFNSFGFAAPFAYANGQSCIVGPSPTAPGASCTVAVQFAPTAVGNATGSVTVTDNAANESAPQAIGLSGTGVAIAQAISFTLATPVTYGAGAITLSATGGGSGSPVTFSITSGSQYATLSGTNNATLTITGAGTVVVAANQAGNSTYAAAPQVTQTLVINAAADTLTIATIGTQTYPVASPLSAVATGSSAGVITYSVTGPATISATGLLTITGAGTVVVTANQAANGNYLAGTATETITVGKAVDNLAITPSGTFTYPVAAPVSVATTGSSTGAITFSVTGPATINATTGLLTITGAGSVVVTADQAADANYLAGTATETITVNQAADTLSIAAIPTQTYPVASPLSAVATGSSNGAITYSVTGPATISAAGQLTITGAGTVVVTANQAATSNYLAGTATETITVNQAADTLSIAAIPTQIYPVASPLSAVATGSSNGAITYSVTGPATISAAGLLTITSAGTVVVTANQAATSNYLAGTATETITVNQAADNLAITPSGTFTYPVAAPVSVATTGSSTGAITFSVTGPATINATSGLLTITGAGTVVVTANQAANGNYLAGTATETITVNQAADTLTIAAIPTQTYPVASPLSAVATGSSNGAITYSVTGPATISAAGQLTITGAGTVVVTANQAATSNYLAGTATETITVNQAADTLSIAAIPTQIYPVASPLSAVATGSSNGAITYSVTGPATISAAGQLTITGAGTVVVTANQAATSNYLAGTATETITVNQAADTLSIAAIPTQTYPVASPLSAVATGSSNGAITYSVTGPATISAAGLLTITGAGTVVVTANQAATSNYLAGTATETITVNQAADNLAITPSGTFTYPVAAPVSVATTGSSTGAITFSVTGPATINATSGLLTITGAGTVVVTANQAANGNYLAGTATETITVNQAADTLTIAAIPTQTYPVSSPLSAVATGSSAGAITYSVTGPATISAAGQLTITSAGTVIVTADQAANGNYLAGTATETITVNQAADTLSIATIGTQTYPVASPLSAVATSPSAGAITYSVTGPATISAAGQLTITGAGTVIVTADQAANGNYLAGTATETITVNQAADTLTIAAIPTQTYPVASPLSAVATSPSAGAITYSVTGPATISATGQLTITGAGTVVVTANQAANGNYLAGTATETITVNQAADTLSIATIPTQTYPVSSPLSAVATGSSAGAITYSVTGPATISAAGQLTITGAGTVIVTADQAANGNYLAGTATETITVNQAADTLSIATIGTQTYPVSSPLSAVATGSSAGAITYSVTGPATINPTTGQLTITGAGTVVVTANQAASGNYLAGTATETIIVNQAADTLTIAAIPTQTYPVASPLSAVATSPSAGAITYSVTGPATISAAGQLTITGAGTVVVTADQAANGNYLAGTATETITVNQAADTLSIATIGTQTYPVSSPLSAVATGSSNGAITYSVTGPATISAAGQLTITGAGTVVVTADQAASGNYLAGTATETITVNQAADTLSIATIGTQTYPVSSPLSAVATSPSAGAITYSVTGPATISAAGQLTITGAGTVIVTADQAANGNYLAGTATETITVNQAADTLSIATIGTQTYPVSSPLSAVATGSSNGAITYSVTGPATISATGQLTITGPGTVVITANQAANGNYLAGTATETITVNQGTQTVTLQPLSLPAGGASIGATITLLGSSSVAGLPITYTVTGPATVSGNILTVTGNGAITVTANQAGNTDYASASSLPQSFTSGPASQTITFPAPASASYGSTLALGATASSGLPVSYQLVSGPATVSSSGTITITGVGTVTVEATQAGNASFNPATPVTVRFTATPAVLTVTATSIGETYGSVDPDSCGNVNRHLTYTVTGYVNGNTSSILRGSPNESTTAQPNSGVGSYPITITQGQMSLNSSDYTLVFVNGTLTVTPAALTVTGSNASMVYGTAVPALSATISGFVNNDRSSVVHGAATASTTATSSSDPGAYPVTPNLSGLSAANYTFTAVNGTLTITQASQSISFASIGQQNAPGTLTLAATASSGLPISYTVSGPATLSGSILTLTAAGTVSVTASQPGNLDYNAAQPVTQSFRVTGAKQSQTITVNAGTAPAGGYTYGGTVALNASASSGLSVSYAVTGPATVSSTGVVSFTGAGTVTVTITQSGNSTYNAATAVTKTFTVSPAVLTVTATSQSVVYGAVDPDHCGNVSRHLTYTVSGFVNGDSSSILSGSPDETTTATPTSGVGAYPITITQGSLSAGSGYTFVFVNGTLTITPAVLTVTCNNASGYYGQVDPDNCGHAERHNQFGYTVTGYVNGDGGSVVGGQGAPTTTANQGSGPGGYPITLPQGCLHAANYTFNYVAGTFTVSNQGGNGGR